MIPRNFAKLRGYHGLLGGWLDANLWFKALTKYLRSTKIWVFPIFDFDTGLASSTPSFGVSALEVHARGNASKSPRKPSFLQAYQCQLDRAFWETPTCLPILKHPFRAAGPTVAWISHPARLFHRRGSS